MKNDDKRWRLVSQLEALAGYWYQGPRAIGQTYAMRVGAENFDRSAVLVLVHNRQHGMDISRAALMKGNVVVPITPDNLDKLRGCRAPLLADHFVMGQLLHEAAAEIRRLRSQLGQIASVLEQ